MESLVKGLSKIVFVWQQVYIKKPGAAEEGTDQGYADGRQRGQFKLLHRQPDIFYYSHFPFRWKCWGKSWSSWVGRWSQEVEGRQGKSQRRKPPRVKTRRTRRRSLKSQDREENWRIPRKRKIPWKGEGKSLKSRKGNRKVGIKRKEVEVCSTQWVHILQ